MATPRRLGYLGLGKQVAKGTAIAPTKFVKWSGTTQMTPEQPSTMYQEGGDGFLPATMLKEQHKPDGNFQFLARPDLTAMVLAFWAGTDTVTGVGPYTHTLALNDTLPWASIERSLNAVLIDRKVDCRIKSVKVEGEAGKPLMVTVEYLGISEDASVSAATASYETDSPWVFYQGTYTKDGSGVSAYVTRFALTLVNVFDENYFSNAVTRQDIPLVGRTAELEAEIVMEDSAAIYKDTYLGGGTAAGKAMDTGSFAISLTYGSGAAARTLSLTVNSLYYTEAPLELADNEEVHKYAIKAQGRKASGSDFLTASVINGTSAAYV